MLAVIVLLKKKFKMSSSRKTDIYEKYYSLTDCMLHLMSSTFNDKRASAIKLYIDFRREYFQFICKGMALRISEMKLINNCNQLEKKKIINIAGDGYLQTLSRIAVNSKKVIIVSTKKKCPAYEVVFEKGIRTRTRFISSKNKVSTIIKMYGLINITRPFEDRGCYEYFVLKNHLKALTLIHCSIPIYVTEKIYGKVIRRSGKFTGLGSSFSALVQSTANIILPVHAKFHDVRMKAFFALDLYSNRFHQYVYVNNNFVRWKYLYTYFNQILGKTFEISTAGNSSRFKFVLCIECPNEYCQIHYGFFTPEIRLKNLNPVVSCFNILVSNIEMMFKCKQWYPFDRHMVQKCVNFSSKECFKGSHTKLILILDYSWEHDFEILMEPLIIMKRRQDLNIMKQSEYLYQNLLIFKNEFGSYRLTLYDENLEISLPALLQFITFLLDSWSDYQARRNGFFNFLKEIISSFHNMPTLEDINAQLRLNDISKTYTHKLKSQQSNVESLSLSCDTHYILKSCSIGTGKGGKVLDSDSVSWFHLGGLTNVNLPQNFSTVGRNSYAPKGTSPMAVKIENIAVCSGYRIRESTNTCDIIQKSLAVDKNIDLSRKLKTQIFDGEITMIPKDLFGHMKVIGQLDSKFIVCELKKQQKPNETGFIIFDQHGIDERVRLEDLSNKNSDNSNLPKYLMDNWILLKLENEEIALLLQFTNYFSKFGIDINSISSGSLTIQSIPEILHKLGEYWTRTPSGYMNYMFNILKTIVEEQLNSIKLTGSTTNVIPNVLHKQMCKTACSSAIKFGQYLSLMDCCNLVAKLSTCSMPFLCAHGRPTALFVGGIMVNDKNDSPPNLKALKQANI